MKVLIPVDGSQYSLGAVKFISTLDFNPSDELKLLYVIDFVPMSSEIPSYLETFHKILQDVAPRIIEEAKNLLKNSNALVKTSIEEGNTAQTIIDIASEEKMDFIIMGTRGSKGLQGLLLGSTARAVAHKASVPVLVIRKNLWDKKGSLRVLIATDGSEYAQNAIESFKKLPVSPDSEIIITHVVQSAVHDIPERFFIEIDDKMKDIVEATRKEEIKNASKLIDSSIKILSEKFKNIKTLIKVGDPSEEILRAANVLQVDLIVTGCRGKTGLRGLLGSVSKDILRHAECSVMVCKKC